MSDDDVLDTACIDPTHDHDVLADFDVTIQGRRGRLVTSWCNTCKHFGSIWEPYTLRQRWSRFLDGHR